MAQIRCLVCGSSHSDPEGYKCERCGGAIGSRSEACYVSEETKKKLLEHAEELSKFGIGLEQHETLQKDAGLTIGAMCLALQIAELLSPGTLRDAVLLLRELAIPEDEMLRLRLDEPEQILKYCRMDTKQDCTAIKWKGMKGIPTRDPVVAPQTALRRGRTRKKRRQVARRKPKSS